MSPHLSSQEISEYVAGVANNASEEHLRECAVCRAETEQLVDTLALFRQSVRQWSLEREHTFSSSPSPRRIVTLQRLGWAAALAACLIGGLSLPREKTKFAATRPTISDADLLVQVDRELSAAVPTSLEPIALRSNQKEDRQ